ncbi:MAG: hypothetical protein AB9M60_17970 [Leptothrix sp. (in: b-proteobacteria)]
MRDPATAPHDWSLDLPQHFSAFIVAPQRFESHVDEAACARKVVGLDGAGRRCYIQHLHTEIEQRFDIDEFPLEVATGRERRIAWRLRSGRWLLQVERIDRLESCRPRRVCGPAVVVREVELGL